MSSTNAKLSHEIMHILKELSEDASISNLENFSFMQAGLIHANRACRRLTNFNAINLFNFASFANELQRIKTWNFRKIYRHRKIVCEIFIFYVAQNMGCGIPTKDRRWYKIKNVQNQLLWINLNDFGKFVRDNVRQRVLWFINYEKRIYPCIVIKI